MLVSKTESSGYFDEGRVEVGNGGKETNVLMHIRKVVSFL